jgi:rhomboid family protein
MFPYHDENETQRTPYVTFVLIALNVAAWVLVQGAGAALPLARSVCELGLIPGELTASVAPGTRFPMGEGLACLTDPGRQVQNVLTSMFLTARGCTSSGTCGSCGSSATTSRTR